MDTPNNHGCTKQHLEVRASSYTHGLLRAFYQLIQLFSLTATPRAPRVNCHGKLLPQLKEQYQTTPLELGIIWGAPHHTRHPQQAGPVPTSSGGGGSRVENGEASGSHQQHTCPQVSGPLKHTHRLVDVRQSFLTHILLMTHCQGRQSVLDLGCLSLYVYVKR